LFYEGTPIGWIKEIKNLKFKAMQINVQKVSVGKDSKIYVNVGFPRALNKPSLVFDFSDEQRRVI